MVPPPPTTVELLDPHPTAPIAATDRHRARSAPQRRRRGTVRRIRHASVAPDPAAYHGVLPTGRWLAGDFSSFNAPVVVDSVAVRTKEVVTAVEEVITTGLTEKA